MMMTLINTLGPWSWIVFGLVLLGLEIIAPGTFFLWFGLSAMVVGLITLLLGMDHAVWVWQFQLLTFLVLSLVSAIAGRRMMVRKQWDKSENPTLNNRGAQLVGRTAVLSEAISEGRGRAKIGDTIWQVSGAKMKEGARVRIVGHNGAVLEVEADG